VHEPKVRESLDFTNIDVKGRTCSEVVINKDLTVLTLRLKEVESGSYCLAKGCIQ
jgi:hypothetical protein